MRLRGKTNVAGLLQRPVFRHPVDLRRVLKQPTYLGIPLALLLSTQTTALAQDGLRPIRGPIVPGFWEENATWAIPALIVGGLLLLLLGWWIWKRVTIEKILSPREEYEKEVDEIENLLREGHTGEIPARLSRVLRTYIEASTGIRAPEQTTEEFLAEVLPGGIGEPNPDAESPRESSTSEEAADLEEPTVPARNETFEILRPFLKLIDEAKFAARPLDADDCRTLIDQANRFVSVNEENKPRR